MTWCAVKYQTIRPTWKRLTTWHQSTGNKPYLRLARALAPELVLELPELLEDELERDVDPELELWDELDPLDDLELLSDELKVNNTKKRDISLAKIKQ
jgi:hypothetical protein